LVRNRKAFAAVIFNSLAISLMVLSVYWHIGEFPDLFKYKPDEEGKKLASNAYAVIDGKIYTAPKDEKVLPGITRELILELAVSAGITVKEQAVTEQQLRDADEIWVSSSTKEVLPVTTLDGVAVSSGKPGEVWKKIDALYQQYKQQGGF